MPLLLATKGPDPDASRNVGLPTRVIDDQMLEALRLYHSPQRSRGQIFFRNLLGFLNTLLFVSERLGLITCIPNTDSRCVGSLSRPVLTISLAENWYNKPGT